MDKISVLFICAGNSARSQIAEALLKKYGSGHFDVCSAGLRPKGINPLTIQVLQEVGIDIRQNRSKPLTEFLGKQRVDYAIFVCHGVEPDCPTVYPFSLKQCFWPFDDPAEAKGTQDERLAAFRSIRNQIEKRILAWFLELGYTPTHP